MIHAREIRIYTSHCTYDANLQRAHAAAGRGCIGAHGHAREKNGNISLHGDEKRIQAAGERLLRLVDLSQYAMIMARTFLLLKIALVLAIFPSASFAGEAPMPHVIIRPGISMPVVGLGSCCGTYNVTAWIEMGYRHIDTSCDYGSQPAIGTAVRASGVPRSQFFITSKINPENYGPDVSEVVQQQVLSPLGTPYVDLLLMHHAGRPASQKNR